MGQKESMLVRFVDILRPLKLHLKSLHADLKSIHRLNGSVCAGWVIKADEAKTLALVSGSINVDFGTEYIAEWQEHLSQLSIAKLLRQVVDEEVAAFRTNW